MSARPKPIDSGCCRTNLFCMRQNRYCMRHNAERTQKKLPSATNLLPLLPVEEAALQQGCTVHQLHVSRHRVRAGDHCTRIERDECFFQGRASGANPDLGTAFAKSESRHSPPAKLLCRVAGAERKPHSRDRTQNQQVPRC